MADSVRRTSEKLVGPYLPRPLTSPSCGTPRHPAPALTGVGCERVSGTRMDTLVDDLGNIEKIMNTKTKQKIVYGAGEGYPSTGAAAGCKAGPAALSSSNRGRPGVGRQAPGCALASGEEDTGASRDGTRWRRGRCSPCPLPGRGGRTARLRGVGRVAGRGQRLQQHSLGQDMPGSWVSSGTRVSTGCGLGIFLGPKHRLHRPWRGDDWEGGVPRGPAGLRARSAAMEHRVLRGASSADASGLGAGVLCRRHVGAGLGRGVGWNRPSGETGCSPRGRRDQGIGAEGVPWEVRGNVVLPQGRSRDASSGLSPEVGGGWDRGRNQHEIPGPDPRRSLDLPRSLRAPGTGARLGRGDGERIRTFAVSAGVRPGVRANFLHVKKKRKEKRKKSYHFL